MIFLTKSILKSLLGLHLNAHFRLLIFLSDNVTTILTDCTIRVGRDIPTRAQMKFWLSWNGLYYLRVNLTILFVENCDKYGKFNTKSLG